MAKDMTAIDTSHREILKSRLIDAPRELVFQAWSDPEHITHWWGPRGFRTTTHAMEFRPGGEWLFTMHGPDGTDYENRITYREVERPLLIVYDHRGVGDAADVVFTTTVTLEDDSGRTRLTFRMVFASPESRDYVVEKYGAVEGLEHTLERLAEQVALTAGTDSRPALEIKRMFDAPRELVFKAWTEPDRMTHWLGPKDFVVTSCRLDPIPGGLYRACIQSPEGREHWMSGEYHEVIEPHRLVFSFAWDDENGVRGHETLVSVSLRDVGGKTELTFRQAIFPSVDSRDSHHSGWSECFDRLADYLVTR